MSLECKEHFIIASDLLKNIKSNYHNSYLISCYISYFKDQILNLLSLECKEHFIIASVLVKKPLPSQIISH